jgi:GNAT superfamily N-acetyltransferase
MQVCLVKIRQAMQEIKPMNTRYAFRIGNSGDLNQIKELNLQVYMQFRNIISKENAEAWEENLGNETTYTELFKMAFCFVCEFENRIIGSAFLIPHGNPYKWFESGWAYIRLVAVHPDFAGNGIGKKLVQMCIEKANALGEKTIALHTSEFQDAARHIYESIGFLKKKEFELYGKRYWIYTLQKSETNNITYRRATIADVQSLVVYRILFALELSGEQPMEKTDTLKKQIANYFLRATADNTCISYIATCDGITTGIGSVHFREMPGNFKNPSGKWGYIMNMYTVPAFRRKGICKTILNLLVEEGNKAGVTAFELHATKEGEMVYSREGFMIHKEPTYRKFI